jgi:hypothetical protein
VRGDAWTVLDGPIFLGQASDEMAKFIMVLIVAVTLVNIGDQGISQRASESEGGSACGSLSARCRGWC